MATNSNLSSIENVFSQINKDLESESELKDKIKTVTKDIDQILRQAQYNLQHVHANPKQLKEIAVKINGFFPALKTHFVTLQQLASGEQYYKFISSWKFAVQQSVTLAAFADWALEGKLVTIPHVEALLGLPGKQQNGNPHAWAVELDDFLTGLSFLPSELSRLCLNSVIVEDYATPKVIFNFVSDLFAGFRLLNLKNDFLRKRFDTIKYDMKKIEEILYDIEIRKLGKTAAEAPAQ